MWVIYKKILIADGDVDRHDLILAQTAFCSGARGVLKVLDDMMQQGKIAKMHTTIDRHARQIDKIQRRPPDRRH
jgi:hypothetical protein